MPGFFSVPKSDIRGASLLEITEMALARASTSTGVEDNAGASLVLKYLAAIAPPFLLEIKGQDGRPILKSDLEVDAAAKIKALLEQVPEGRLRRKLIHRVRKELARSDQAHKRENERLGRDLEWLQRAERGVLEVDAWIRGGVPQMEKPSSSKLHKFRDAVAAGNIFDATAKNAKMLDAPGFLDLIERSSVFVVEHDWAAAFRNATDYGAGEIKLPDEVCAFEFRLGGRNIIAIAIEADGIVIEVAAETSEGWFVFHHSRRDLSGQWHHPSGCGDQWTDLVTRVGDQVVAIAVALEAEVATTEVIRASHKLNHARERRGKLPMFDYHVVSLARRSRAPALPSPASDGEEPKRHVRLHFRRGHWRHYENHKTWIKWMLVGDPDLGFVDKHYRL